MRSLTVTVFLFLFISCSSSTEVYEYEIYSDDKVDLVDSKLLFNINKSSSTVHLDVQIFPKNQRDIESYSLVFDMKFREDYESDFDGVCIGPTWNETKPGELKVILNKEDNFKSKVTANFDSNSLEDRCEKYIYYLRYFQANINSEQKIFFGVATDYAELYPDAPNYWLVNKNNEIEKIGTSNIKKYSIYFELSK